MELLGVAEKVEGEALEVLVSFKNANTATRGFDMKPENRQRVWAELFSLIRGSDWSNLPGTDQSQGARLRLESLNCARILSRDKTGLNEVEEYSVQWHELKNRCFHKKIVETMRNSV